jgi:hypothetical protein
MQFDSTVLFTLCGSQDASTSSRKRFVEGKSLAQQLAEQKEEKDAEWKKANNPFQPPPSLTDDGFVCF